MTENVWGTETVQGHSHPPKSHWSMEQIACHSTRIVILFASIMCLLTVGLVSADFQAGLDAYEQGNYKVALKEWKPLAESGDSKARFRLGVMYDNGEGVAQDYVTAHVWYNLAGIHGDEKAREYRDRIAEKMTPSQIAEAQRRAREWKSKSDD